jgi:hypothetical protein
MFHRYLSLFILLSFTFLNSCGVIYFTPTIKTFERDEIKGASTRGPYYTSKYPINLNSERIVIKTKDRVLTDKVIKTTYLEREIDYIIDYKLGKIIFLRKIDSFDSNFDNNYIVIDYDYNQSMYWEKPSYNERIY